MSLQKYDTSFASEPGFCPNCGTILPLAADLNAVKCLLCQTQYGPEAYGGMESSYVIHFHSPSDYLQVSEKSGGGTDGPVVDRKCPKCHNEKMSYATLQLRSADEGQTVFYTCTKCKYKESENS